MAVIRRLSPATNATTAVMLAVVMLSATRAGQRTDKPSIHIQNFGCVNERLYRGAQPKTSDYAGLAAFGIKTVIDLQRDGEAGEQRLVEAAGMKFYRIGMSDKSWPTREQADEFLRLVSDPSNQPVFIHCHGGRHRTGAMAAIYRIKFEGWTAERAYEEMKQYQFDKGIGHGALKDYVFDYCSQMEQKSSSAGASR